MWASMKLHKEWRGDVAAVTEPNNLCKGGMWVLAGIMQRSGGLPRLLTSSMFLACFMGRVVLVRTLMAGACGGRHGLSKGEHTVNTRMRRKQRKGRWRRKGR